MKKLMAHDEDNLRDTAEISLAGCVDETQWALIVGSLDRDVDAVLDMLRSVEDNVEAGKAGEIRNFIESVEKMALPMIETEDWP